MMTLSVTREKAWNMPQHQKSCPMSGAAGFLNTASLEKLWDPACLLHTHTVPPCHNLIKEKLLQLVAAWNLWMDIIGVAFTSAHEDPTASVFCRTNIVADDHLAAA
jgi:hypothetical protein